MEQALNHKATLFSANPAQSDHGSMGTLSPAAERKILAEKFIRNLESQAKAYMEYKAVCEQQRMALVNNQLEENQAVNRSLESITPKLDQMNRDRQEISHAILDLEPSNLRRFRMQSDKPIKCEKIVSLVDSEYTERILKARDLLVQNAKAAQQLNQINISLVENARKIIHTTVAIVTSVANRGKQDLQGTYGSDRHRHEVKKQVRSLFSCKA